MYKKVDASLNFLDREKEVLKFWDEEKVFEKSIKNVNYDKLVRVYRFDYDSYLKDFPTQKPFVDCVKEFSSSSIGTLYNAVAEMC